MAEENRPKKKKVSFSATGLGGGVGRLGRRGASVMKGGSTNEKGEGGKDLLLYVRRSK